MKKSITFVVGCVNKLGGTEKATIDLANLLVKRGYKVSLVSIYKKIANQNNTYDIDDNIDINYVFSEVEFLKYHLNIYRLLDYISKKKVNKIINQNNPDIVFYTSIKHIPFENNRFKKILMVHNCYEYYRSGRLTKSLLNKNYKKIDNIIYLSKKDLDKYEKEFDAGNGDFVYNISQIQPSVKSKYNKKKITYMGRLDNDVKQLDHAILAIDQLVQKKIFEDWKFQIFGSGPHEAEIKSLIKNKGLEKYIELKGTTSEVEKVMSESDIIMLTSDFEGLPMCLIEGASCGVPLISYDSSAGIHDIIIDSYNGYIVEKNNIKLLSEKVGKLVLDKNLRRTLGSNGVKHIQENFSEEKIYTKWTRLIDN
ncbi:glycosyltransferase [Priestia aryabhattai]|uniref:glycosyltransferase n=1 Tax=Priestia aryabhattai TaxID=412384 RepID=UPI001C8D7B98|nr:glycosyltransferase [Priestia aryabhattai]MBX9987790.1 glycosyltransferase [Priestia aryabhattai]